MTDDGIYATNEDILAKAGAKASSVSISTSYTNRYIAQAEGVINCLCRQVFASTTAEFAALPATTRTILTDAASNLAAMGVINYDMSGFTSRTEAEDMLNVLRDGALRDLKFLEDKKNQAFLLTGAP